jgi:predicted O-methyltransferase YrrM
VNEGTPAPSTAEAQQERWTAVDRYLADLLVPPDSALDAALRASAAAGLPPHDVTPNQGRLLELLARVHGARAILELGTLGGYSTIWLARALPPDGRLITLEADPRYAEVARANIARAGLADVVDLRLGRALETLPEVAAEGRGPFDLIFLDADKASNPDYFAYAQEPWSTPPAAMPVSAECAGFSSCWAPTRASAQLRSRRWGVKDTTASRSRS